MAQQQVFVSKTQHYLKVQKPLLERQRRARMNKCLDSLKMLVAEFQGDDAILRMDKAEMLESALVFIRKEVTAKTKQPLSAPVPVPMDSFKNGYMNAVNEVSRIMACTPSMNVEVGKTVMTQLGSEFQRLIRADLIQQQPEQQQEQLKNKERPLSPASSGYHSDCEDIEMISPTKETISTDNTVWRPW